MRSKSGRGWRLFFGAKWRQAAGFRQCWIAREILGLPLVFWRRLQTIMMRMPLAMLRAKNRPGKNRQRHQEKSAKINKDLSNGGSGGNQ